MGLHGAEGSSTSRRIAVPMEWSSVPEGIAVAVLGGALRGMLPTAREYGEHHVAIYGLPSGMAVMAASLALMA